MWNPINSSCKKISERFMVSGNCNEGSLETSSLFLLKLTGENWLLRMILVSSVGSNHMRFASTWRTAFVLTSRKVLTISATRIVRKHSMTTNKKRRYSTTPSDLNDRQGKGKEKRRFSQETLFAVLSVHWRDLTSRLRMNTSRFQKKGDSSIVVPLMVLSKLTLYVEHLRLETTLDDGYRLAGSQSPLISLTRQSKDQAVS